MVTFSLLIILLLILFGIYKILKGIISFFFGSNSNSNGDKITFYDIMDDDGPSDLKYNDEVYISYRNKVQKAYESFKKSGYNIVWDSDNDGFMICEDILPSFGGSMYIVGVHCDDHNISKLNNPFYIVVTYSILFDKFYHDKYEEKGEYLNNCIKELKKSALFFTVHIDDVTNFGAYNCQLVASDYKDLYEDIEKLGEAEVFKQLMDKAKQCYHAGEDIYNAKLDGDEINFSK